MITSTGIGSGLDIESLVTQLVAAERDPVESRLVNNEFQFTSELSALGQFQGALSSVESALGSLATLSTFRSLNASSSNQDALTVTASSSATPSSYQVGITQLAQAHSLATTNFSSLEQEIGTGTLTIRFGTTDYVPEDPGPESYNSFSINAESDTLSIDIDSTNNTLEGIRDAINAENGDVNAVIVNDGDGFRLLLTSANEGGANSIQVSVEDTGDLNNTDTAGLSALAFNQDATNLQQTVTAQDAIFSINGLSISNDSNTVTEAVEGVSLELNEITESDARVSVTRDTAAVSEAINGFLEAYNNFNQTVDQLAGFDVESGTGGILQGDFTVRSIEGRLRSLIGGEVTGVSGSFRFLSEIGITTDASGNLSLDQSRLNEVLAEDPSGVADLFAAVGRPEHVGVEFIGDSDDTQVGDYEINITQAAARAELIGATIGFPLVVDENNNGFVIEVNGDSSELIELTQGTYATGAEFAAELQSRINGDDALSEANRRVSVELNDITNALEIRSLEFGSEVSLEIVSGDINFASSLGLTLDLIAEGQDVEGTIGGQAATGIGQSLVADEGTDAAGLSLIIETDQIGSLGEVAFSRGIADQLRTLIGEYVDTGGLINSRTDSIGERIDDIEEQREALELRLESVESRFRAQFNALDSLLANLNSTSTFLTTQLANLPGPRTSDN